MRRKANEADSGQSLVMLEPEPEALRQAKRRWAELLRRIFEVDPLMCPRCGQPTMRIVAFITEPNTIARTIAAAEAVGLSTCANHPSILPRQPGF